MTITFPENDDSPVADILKCWVETLEKEPSSAFGLLHITQDGIAVPWLCYHAGKLPKEIHVLDEKNHLAALPYTSPILSGMDREFGGCRLQDVAFPQTEVKKLQEKLDDASDILLENFSHFSRVQNASSSFLQAVERLSWHCSKWPDIMNICYEAKKFWESFHEPDAALFQLIEGWNDLEAKIDGILDPPKPDEDILRKMGEQGKLARKNLSILKELPDALNAPSPKQEELRSFAESRERLCDFIYLRPTTGRAHAEGRNLEKFLTQKTCLFSDALYYVNTVQYLLDEAIEEVNPQKRSKNKSGQKKPLLPMGQERILLRLLQQVRKNLESL